MTTSFYGTSYVAWYLGTTQSSVTNWAKSSSGFPEPDVLIVSETGKITARAWADAKLPDLRVWMERKLGLSGEDAQEYWIRVDSDGPDKIRVKKDNVSRNQEVLFS